MGLSLLSLGSCTWPLAAMVEFTCWGNVHACAPRAALAVIKGFLFKERDWITHKVRYSNEHVVTERM